MRIRRLFEEEISKEVGEISSMELGSEEYKATVDGATKMADRYIKLKEVSLEEQKMEIEAKKMEVEERRMEDERVDRRWKNGIAIGGTVLGATITVLAYAWSFIYEEKGSILSKPGNKALDRALNFFKK